MSSLKKIAKPPKIYTYLMFSGDTYDFVGYIY